MYFAWCFYLLFLNVFWWFNKAVLVFVEMMPISSVCICVYLRSINGRLKFCTVVLPHLVYPVFA